MQIKLKIPKKLKLVDSLNKKSMVWRIATHNLIVGEFRKWGNKSLDKHWKREHTKIKVISIINTQEIWVKE